MKKITLLILMSFLPFLGFAQFPEGFEGGVPPAGWTVSNNGIGTGQEWVANTAFPRTGTTAAFINTGNIGAGNTSEDWLTTSLVTVPTNGQFRFWLRQLFIGNQGTVIKVKVSTTSQTDHSTFTTTIGQWDEVQLNDTNNTSYFEHKADFPPGLFGQQVYIAIIREVTQPSTTVVGDRILIDDVNLIQKCLDPVGPNATSITTTTASLSWLNPSGATQWEIELVNVTAGGTQTGVGTLINQNPYPQTGLTPGTNYNYYVRALCANGIYSEWVGPLSFATKALGTTCAEPIPVSVLPYSHTSNTLIYADAIEGSPGASCGITGNYLNGNEVIYAYTAGFTGFVDITMNPGGANSGIFVYSSCANINVQCMAGVANTGTAPRVITNFAVTTGTTYYIVISSTGTPQTMDYTLILQQVNCLPPNALGVTNITQTGATLQWGVTGTATSWEYVVQAPGAGLPAGAGTTTGSNTATTVGGLTPATNYEYYVRADCGDGTFSAWAGPFPFFTLCAPYTVPFFEGFNAVTPSASTSEVCWTVLNLNGDANAWNMNYATSPFEGDQAASIVSSTSTNDDWLISPQITLNGNQRLRYRYRVLSASSVCNFEVKFSTTGPNAAGFAGAANTIVAQATYSNITYIENIVNIPATAIGDVNIGFHVAPGTNGSRIFIDRVIVENIPPCPEPTITSVLPVTHNSATINWTPGGTETTWQIYVVPTGSPAPTLPTQGVTVTAPSPYVATGLNGSTIYDVYMLADCGANGPSVWVGPFSFTTQVAPPVCGGTFMDSGGTLANYSNNEDLSWTITPAVPGEVVTVTFTAFNTQANNDALYVFNGNSIAAPQFVSPNGAGAVPGGLPGGYWGTTLPPPFRSSAADGSLTFRFRSTASVNAAGWVANVTCAPPPTCIEPVSITQSGATHNSVNLAWTGGNATAWEVIAVPCGSPRPTEATPGWVAAATNPFTLTGLNAITCYDFYVRGICSPTDASSVTGPATVTTLVAPPVCGGVFYDTGGPSGAYTNNQNTTWTIFPANPGDVVTVTFTSFNTQANSDALYVFNGNTTGAPQFTSVNGAGTVPGGLAGGYWGTTIPGPFTSTAADGSLTFNFISNGSTTAAGWVANVTCAPRPTCEAPISLSQSAVTYNSVNLAWTGGSATAWEVIAVPCGSPRPTGATAGWVAAPTNPFTLTGLTGSTCYDFYVRGVCSPTDASLAVGPVTATTPVTPPLCGGTFTDNGGATGQYTNSHDQTWTICPTNPGDTVTVTFTSFNTEANWDALYVFDGNSIAAPQLASANGAGNVPGGLAGGYWGTVNPGTFTSSSPDGCLTFRFRSDGSGVRDGWIANITCAPAPNCTKPTTLTATNITSTSALLSWLETGTSTQWEIYVVPFGSPIPTDTTTGIIVGVNPALITSLNPSTQYTYYVRAICPTSGTSFWSNGFNFTTAPSNDECATATFVPVNANAFCNQTVSGTLSLATGSTAPAIVAPCVGTPNDDVWFQFIATNSYLNVSLQNVLGSTTNVNFAVYSGSCAGLTQVFCSAANALQGTLNALTVGQTYYIRVYSNSASPQTTTFDLCISTPSTCATASTVCSITYGNTTGVTSLGTIGCLFSSPNPTYFTIQVGTSGPINFELTQSSPGSATPDLDVDYAAWGPYTSQAAACAAGIPFIPPTNTNPSGIAQDHGCSYSAAPIEQFNIPNAQAGEFYIILITNFSNDSGTISLNQTNAGAPGAGVTVCCPDANFSYVPGTYCKGSSANPVAVIATGSLSGTFSSPNPAVVFVNTATGEIDLAATPAGNYIIYNTLAATATCGVKTYSYVITIVEPASATISYSAPSYCNNLAGTQAVTVTGTPGGTFSVTPIGLNINPMTGAITPVGSAPNTYTVSYNFPVTSGCGVTSFTTTVTILPTPVPVPVTQQPTCTVPTGTITVGVTPATGSYEYSIDGGLTYFASNVFSGLAPNSTHNVMVRDTVTGCTSVVVVQPINAIPAAPNAPTWTATQPTCTTDGQIVLNATVSNLFISEVTDSNAGSLTYVEIYNGTGATVNLSGYKLKFYNNGSTSTSCDIALTGTVANNNVRIIAVGSTTNQGGVVPHQVAAGCGGVNIDDNIRLTTSTDVEIDNWGRRDGVAFTPNNQPGYVYRRLATAIVPNNTWNPADWTVIDPEVYTNVGTHASLSSNYQYSIGGAYQTSNTFDNVPVGTYTATVMDMVTGCVSAPSTPIVLTVPAAPTATISYAATSFCSTDATPKPVTLTGTGDYTSGTYSSTAGLTIDSISGAITPSTSTPGVYTVTYTIPVSLNCPLVTATTTVTIDEAPTAVISYAAASYCSTDVTPYTVTLTGTGAYTGGTFTATPAGLIIDATTGAITPSGSVPQLYTVTYAIPASGSCLSTSVSTTITIDEAPTAAISYAAVSYCSTDATSYTVTLTGTGAYTGGTFTASPAGLIIDATTGTITPNGSIPQVYTVTYAMLANGSCLSTSVSTTVTIDEAPTAAISYVPASFCSSDATPYSVTVTGTGSFNGGTYSATPSGLTIDPVTGVITPNTSTPGTYTVSYAIPANGSCGSNTVSTTVIVDELPTASISYTSASYCTTTTADQTVLLTGTGSFNGGTFTATPAGLVINATTGAITPSTSIPQTYTVTYAIPANGSCASTNVTTTVTIDEAPTASISYDALSFCSTETTPQAVTLTGSGAYTGGTFTVTPAGLLIDATTGAITANGSAPQTYTVTYTIPANGTCSSTTAITTVTINQPISVTIEQGCVDGVYTLTAIPNDASLDYEWHLVSSTTVLGTDGTLAVTASGTYVVDVTSFGSCVFSAQVVVTNTICEIPKGISPNGDGKNDSFDLSGLNVTKLSIFNRYGVSTYDYGSG
ncbi:choice-of-anchor J domain-containing protein, partial [Flavobacterium saliperosum]